MLARISFKVNLLFKPVLPVESFMKLAFVSDTHFGFAQGGVRDRDAFNQAWQAMKAAVASQPDAIIMPGDLFDGEIPTPESWHDAFTVFKESLSSPFDPKVNVTYCKNGESKSCSYQGVPVIALHGTHDYRSKEFKNAMDILETAGFMIHVHAGHVLLEKNAEHVGVFGLSGVPEKKAREVLQLWNPKPLTDAYNVFMFHQSVREFLPTDDEMAVSLSLSDLPMGFDLLVDGHLHWPQVHDLEDGRRFLLCGSTVTTQMKRLESTKPKGWWLLDTKTNQLDFHPIEKQRKLYYHTIKVNDETPDVIVEKVKQAVEKSLQESVGEQLAPMIRVKVSGSLAKGFSPADVNLNLIESEVGEKAVLSLDKRLSSQEFAQNLQHLRSQHAEKKSVTQMGFDLFCQQLLETGFPKNIDVKELFELLEKEELDKAQELLLEKKESV